MICISLWQPWASLLVRGVKKVETRGWPIRHRGPLLVHAGKKWDAELRGICRQEPFRLVLKNPPAGTEAAPGLPLGVIVGRVTVVECFRTEDVFIDRDGEVRMSANGRRLQINDVERAFGDFSPGRFAWLCADPVAFATPIPFRGLQGLFEVPDELLVAGEHPPVFTAKKPEPSLFDEVN